MTLPVIISETAYITFESICTQIHERLGAKALSDLKRIRLKL